MAKRAKNKRHSAKARAHPVQRVSKDIADAGMSIEQKKSLESALKALRPVFSETKPDVVDKILSAVLEHGKYLKEHEKHVPKGTWPESGRHDELPPMLVDRVEALTGPQGAFFGADSATGVIEFIRRKSPPALEQSLENAEALIESSILHAYGKNLTFEDWTRAAKFLRSRWSDVIYGPIGGHGTSAPEKQQETRMSNDEQTDLAQALAATKREATRKRVAALRPNKKSHTIRLAEDQNEKLKAIAAAKDKNIQAYMEDLVSEDITANAHLVLIGKRKLLHGGAPRRVRSKQLAEENKRLRAELAKLKPT